MIFVEMLSEDQKLDPCSTPAMCAIFLEGPIVLNSAVILCNGMMRLQALPWRVPGYESSNNLSSSSQTSAAVPSSRIFSNSMLTMVYHGGS